MSLPVTLCGTPGPSLCFLPLETPDIEPGEFSTFQYVGDSVDKTITCNKNVEGELAEQGPHVQRPAVERSPEHLILQESSGGRQRMQLPGRG